MRVCVSTGKTTTQTGPFRYLHNLLTIDRSTVVVADEILDSCADQECWSSGEDVGRSVQFPFEFSSAAISALPLNGLGSSPLAVGV